MVATAETIAFLEKRATAAISRAEASVVCDSADGKSERAIQSPAFAVSMGQVVMGFRLLWALNGPET